MVMGRPREFDTEKALDDQNIPNGAQNRLLLCLVLPRSEAARNLVPRFDRARNLTPGLPPSSLAV